MGDSTEAPLFLIHKYVPTCVFWNVEDYPIPDGVEPSLIYRRIKEACTGKGCNGEKVSIKFYVDEKRFSDHELRHTYLDAGLQITFLPKGNNELVRASSILRDMMIWAFDQKRANVYVLMKYSLTQDMCYVLEGLYFRAYGVLLAQEQPGGYFPSGSTAKFLTSLFDDGGNPGGSSHNDKLKLEAQIEAQGT